MRINNVNIEKIKKNAFKLCVGVVLGVNIISNPVVVGGDVPEKIVADMTLEEKMATRGGVHIYFENTELINNEEDWVTFFDDNQEGFGFVSSDERDFLITFEPGKYNFYLEKFDAYGSFVINEPGEVINLVIDYKDKDFNIIKDNVNKKVLNK